MNRAFTLLFTKNMYFIIINYWFVILIYYFLK